MTLLPILLPPLLYTSLWELQQMYALVSIFGGFVERKILNLGEVRWGFNGIAVS